MLYSKRIISTFSTPLHAEINTCAILDITGFYIFSTIINYVFNNYKHD